MSSDVGANDRQGSRRGGLAELLRGALAAGSEARGAERILAESFWRTRSPQPLRAWPASTLAPVVSLHPLART
jgi:hypothetical protein